MQKVLTTIHERALVLSEEVDDGDITLTPSEGCELRALQADVAWELSLSGAPLATDEGEESSAELAGRAFGWLKMNASDECGMSLGRAKHAAMRLQLADLCDKALQKMGAGGEGGGEGGGDSGC